MIKAFSEKQEAVLGWWTESSKYKDYDAIICDGAVRSGKTLSFSLSFILWAMTTFNGLNLAICGKTISSAERNVITPLLPLLGKMGMSGSYGRTRGYMVVSSGKYTNRFYIFGGKDEGSAALVQGVTLAGIMFDEVALMPESFINQALARCSVSGSKFWFNCNPEHPKHHFKTEWIDKAKEKRAFHLHFTMDDNPSLTPGVRERYERLYSGVFHDRYIKGLWTVAEGLVYPMFKKEHIISAAPPLNESNIRFYISIDYGQYNAFSAGLWAYDGYTAYRVKEYYYSGRKSGVIKTDEEYVDKIERLIGDLNKNQITLIVDPSASSLIASLRKRYFYVVNAKNAVIDGISRVSSMLDNKRLYINNHCIASIEEFGLYRWDEKKNHDEPIKENDHSMDEIRYFVNEVTADSMVYFGGLEV